MALQGVLLAAAIAVGVLFVPQIPTERSGSGRETIADRPSFEATGSMHTDRTQVDPTQAGTPDGGPLLPKDVWQALVERRWANRDRRARNDARSGRERIEGALQDRTEIEFDETPLGEALSFLSDLHNITIELSPEADVDDPVTLVLSGITLREALDRLLEHRKLRFHVADEVLQVGPIAPARD